uniref:Uncharacterized protein n=1 Tax=Anguilla anguilla TaxID=7936 RepID=A0A0E9UD32_ANGAN
MLPLSSMDSYICLRVAKQSVYNYRFRRLEPGYLNNEWLDYYNQANYQYS